MAAERLRRGWIVGAAVLALTLILRFFHVFDVWEWKSWDLRLHLLSSPSRASRDIVLFLVDQESIDLYQREQGLPWPWPREMYAYIMEYLREAGARAVFLDFLFSESSVYGVEDDLALSDAMRRSGNVFLPLSLSRGERESGRDAILALHRLFGEKSEGHRSGAIPVRSASLPEKVLLEAARGVGNTTFSPDPDGIFRRIPLFFSLDGMPVPSVPLAMARFLEPGFRPETLPLDSEGRMILRYHGPSGTYAGYSAAAVINSFAQAREGKEPQIHARNFEGKIILVGGSAPGILDLRPSPFSPVHPGVEVLATALDNLLHGDAIRPASPFLTAAFLVLLCFLTAVGTSLLVNVWKTVLFIIFCLALPSGAAILAFFSGTWLDTVSPVFAVALSFSSATLLNYGFEGRRRRFIKNAFRYYLSPQVIEKVLEDPSLLRLGGESRAVTSFFSDVAGFTNISESLSPEDLVRLLNEYLSRMTEVILSFGGTLDKYEGDAIIAFWNAPLDQPDHAVRACRAALECQKSLEEMRPLFAREYGRELRARIGLNSGAAVVGNMGSRTRFDYTAMGDTINLASRLEGACKLYGVPILAGENTYTMAREVIAAREVDIVRVVGKARPVRVYQILGEKGKMSAAARSGLAAFREALDLYRERRWEEAEKLFAAMPEDPVSRVYAERIRGFRKSPPPEEWTGVYELKEK